jgi:hypothetical protein
MNNLNLTDLNDNQIKEIEGGFYLIPPAGLAAIIYQIKSIESFIEGYKDAT